MTDSLLSPLPVPEDGSKERLSLIAAVIERLRPGLKADGGDIELVAVDGYKVKVRLGGACSRCGQANATLGGVRRALSQALDGGPVLVVPVT